MGSEPNAYGSTPDPWPSEIPSHEEVRELWRKIRVLREYDLVMAEDPNSVQARLRALEARCAGYETAMPRVVRRLQAVEAELQRLQREGFKSSD